MKKLIAIGIAVAAISAHAAVHHSKRQAAYFAEHEKCAAAYKTAKGEARKKSGDERKQLLKTAREQYDRCEAYAKLVWKYYPEKPPAPAE